ncbi:hypothetical protein CMV_023979 [Castanea mollissima]|uniref:Uncharacterized protein n=1 Tax=Castanea mollissima TaxID=60419 RepID=A0A8J4QBC3_9ROSI|nr:hypothetical protein CMV_023979 [Castanea mollissima]
MECLRILLKDYKNEIDDILVADKQLQKELIYDMQKYDSAKTKSTATEAVAKMKKSSSKRSPDVSKVASGKHAHNKFTNKSKGNSKLASAMADAAAAATARSVLRESSEPQLPKPQPEEEEEEDDDDDDDDESSKPQSKKAAKNEAAKLEKLKRRQEAAVASGVQSLSMEDPLADNYGDVPILDLQSKVAPGTRV